MASAEKEVVGDSEVVAEIKSYQARASGLRGPPPVEMREPEVIAEAAPLVASGKRRKDRLEEIERTDPKQLSLSMAVKKRDRKN